MNKPQSFPDTLESAMLTLMRGLVGVWRTSVSRKGGGDFDSDNPDFKPDVHEEFVVEGQSPMEIAGWAKAVGLRFVEMYLDKWKKKFVESYFALEEVPPFNISPQVPPVSNERLAEARRCLPRVSVGMHPDYQAWLDGRIGFTAAFSRLIPRMDKNIIDSIRHRSSLDMFRDRYGFLVLVVLYVVTLATVIILITLGKIRVIGG